MPGARSDLMQRVAQGPRWRLIAVALTLGALAALGQAPWGLWPLTILGFAGLYGLWRAGRPGLGGWGFGTGYFAVALSWLVEPFMVDAAAHAWMAPFALALMAGGLALFWGVALRLAKGLGAAGFIAALALAEALRGVIFTGFPWAQPGHIWIGTPLMPLAALGGALLLCAVTYALAVLLYEALAGRRVAIAGAGLAVAGIALAYGLSPDPAPLPKDAPVVRLIQPNAPQHQKWDPEMIPTFLRRQAEFTAQLPRPDLVVWPETSVPYLLGDAGVTLEGIARAAGGAPVVLGLRRFDGPRLMNTLVTLDAAGQVSARYDKHHLVPFGEYIPFGRYLKHLGLRGLAAEDGNGYSAGPGPQVIDIEGIGRALPLICYEGVFARHTRVPGARPDVLLLITNDAWFGTVSGPYQHLAQARLRSAEQGLPMIRVANTGISAVIDAKGALRGALPLNEAGYLDLPLPAPGAPTIYARTGDIPMLILLALILGIGWAGRRQAPVT